MTTAATLRVRVDGHELEVPAGHTVAAAIARAEHALFRRGAVDGSPRGPLCGMGVCFECRVRVDGVPHVRACMTPCRADMEIETDAGA